MPTLSTRRYLVALLWHWSIPFVLGMCAGTVAVVFELTTVLPEVERIFTRSIEAACN